MNAARILVVEDEPDMADAICDVLGRYGFVASRVTTCAEARARSSEVDLVLLDLGLPDGDGLDICSALAPVVPVVVVSARGSEADRVAALELGADDYLAKPFGPRELVARCRSVLRRAGSSRTIVRSGDLEVDVDRFEARVAGTPVALTTKERELLVAIARARGRLVRRADLAEDVWGSSQWSVNRSIDVHVSSLRRKLEAAGVADEVVLTVHGLGYRFVE